MSIYKGSQFIAGTPDLSEYAKTSEVTNSINNINNTLSGKANTNLSNVSSNIDYVVESYVNGANWYRIYKSGWCEQGGRVSASSVTSATINFLKPFRDTNISILCTDSTGTTSDSDTEGVDYCILVSDVTTSSFRVSVVKTRQNSCWEAKGYKA